MKGKTSNIPVWFHSIFYHWIVRGDRIVFLWIFYKYNAVFTKFHYNCIINLKSVIIHLFLLSYFLQLLIKNIVIHTNLELTMCQKLTINKEEIIMARYQTPEEMYRRRKIKNNILYASLIILAIGIIVGIQILLYSIWIFPMNCSLATVSQK